MHETVRRYLRKRAARGPWELEPRPARRFPLAIVIPALAESKTLPKTLASLSNCEAYHEETLVVVVVNNRAQGVEEGAAIEDNQRTLRWLHENPRAYPFALSVADASSPGKALPAKGGVGFARKIGFDLALEHLEDGGALVGLDADTAVSRNYLIALHQHFLGSDTAWGAVIDYAHPTDGGYADEIILYETFLRYHALSLRRAGSPYAYHTIGSAMAATAEAYVASGGMNTRQAGEDFYFLERLAKTGHVDRITNTRVFPSARQSWRVPFGTGRALAQPDTLATVYAPESYDVLGEWLTLLQHASVESNDSFRASAHAINASLDAFLENDGFYPDWERIRAEAKSPGQYVRRVHERFGAWTTLKLLHYLRDTRYPDVPIWSAVAGLFEREGAVHAFVAPTDRPGAIAAVEMLRECDRQ